jgi:heterodisulfide reductase subunit B2
MTKQVGYYPGCSLHTSAKEYDRSVRAVLAALQVDLCEISDWNCCGASSGHTVGHTLNHALPLRNLIQAEQVGEELVVPCAACYSLLRSTEVFLNEATEESCELKVSVEGVMNKAYNNSVKVIHPLDLLTRPEMLKKIKETLHFPLKGLKVAPYYGCFLVRPEVAAFDNPEQPQKMDILLRALGAEVVKWSYKTECCGGSLGVVQGASTAPLVNKLVGEAEKAGARALVTACPLCQANIEGRQGREELMPTFYFTELVGLALGLPDCSKWFRSHLIDPSQLVKELEGGV